MAQEWIFLEEPLLANFLAWLIPAHLGHTSAAVQAYPITYLQADHHHFGLAILPNMHVICS